MAVLDLAALKAGVFHHPHIVLAVLMTTVILLFVARLVQLAILALTGRKRSLSAGAGMVLAAGIALAVAGGLANWLFGLQGYVILAEQEKAQLRDGAELQVFDPGPLADIEEIGVLVGLEELELVPREGDTFLPVSRITVWRGHEQPALLEITPSTNGAAGPLRFYQGAFGFAPRIVILRSGETEETVFDQVVPFLTERSGPDGIRFSGSFAKEDQDLRVEGTIRLDSLDENLRGHATLDLTVSSSAKLLGSGSLLPGHFAELDEGYRIGFADLKMWSEIVVSRRSYGPAVLTGTFLALFGGILMQAARWRRR